MALYFDSSAIRTRKEESASVGMYTSPPSPPAYTSLHGGRTEPVRPTFGLSASHLRVLAEPLFGPYFRALNCTQSRCSVQPTYESYRSEEHTSELQSLRHLV